MKGGRKMKEKDDLDLKLSILCDINPPEKTWTLRDLAEILGEKKGRIERIESNAKAKFLEAAKRLHLNEFLQN